MRPASCKPNSTPTAPQRLQRRELRHGQRDPHACVDRPGRDRDQHDEDQRAGDGRNTPLPVAQATR